MIDFNDVQKRLNSLAKRWASLPYTSCGVTFELQSPVVFTDFLYGDGILSYAVVLEALGDDIHNLPDIRNKLFDIPLPLEMRGKKLKYPAMSVGFLGSGVDGITRWRKKWDEVDDDRADFGTKKQQVIKGGGAYKMYDMPVRYVSVKSVKFHCCGNIDIISTLMKKITAIGKKRSQGYGAVRKVVVKAEAKDFSCVKDGFVTRPIPITESKPKWKGEKRFCAYKPPYWLPDNMAECILPREGFME